jgi:glycosyltransferase involved in cell wall biosynthesis
MEKKKNVAWIVPSLSKGGGGAKTILFNADYLFQHGMMVDIYVDSIYFDSHKIRNDIEEKFGKSSCGIYSLSNYHDDYDTTIATYSKLTAEIVRNSKAIDKVYFVQDYEPLFEPMGYQYIARENTYRYGLKGISIGRWLAYKLSKEYGMNMTYYPFCADLNTYKNQNFEREDAVCFVYQPEKPRRCTELGIQALNIVKTLRPQTKIYLYGSSLSASFENDFENLYLLTLDKCNELYNRCKVGLCISASNPSRIPFEMMASGLPVIDIYRENNLYDFPEEGVLLSESTPEAISAAIIHLLDSDEQRKNMSAYGIQHMKKFPSEIEGDSFLKFINNESESIQAPIEKCYHSKPFQATQETFKCRKTLNSYNSLNIRKLILGKIRIEISNLSPKLKNSELVLALWSDPNQKDLQWIPFSKADDIYRTDISMKPETKYILHIYAKNAKGEMSNIIQKEVMN